MTVSEDVTATAAAIDALVAQNSAVIDKLTAMNRTLTETRAFIATPTQAAGAIAAAA